PLPPVRARPLLELVDMVADLTAVPPERRAIAAPAHIGERLDLQAEEERGLLGGEKGASLARAGSAGDFVVVVHCLASFRGCCADARGPSATARDDADGQGAAAGSKIGRGGFRPFCERLNAKEGRRCRPSPRVTPPRWRKRSARLHSA